jgi:hypothetical protein
MTILVLVFLAIVVVLAVVPGPSRARVRAVLLAGAAATPISAVLLLVLSGGANVEWSERLLLGAFMIVFCFMGSVVAVTILGIPLAWALERMRQSTSTMYVLAGASTPVILYGVYCVSGWNADPDPFGMSLRTLLALKGVSYVITRVLVTAGSLAICGALAAFVYRRSMRSSPSVARA